jgi:hypothetical protein
MLVGKLLQRDDLEEQAGCWTVVGAHLTRTMHMYVPAPL